MIRVAGRSPAARLDRRFLLATLRASLLAMLLTAGSASAVATPVPGSCVGGALSAAHHSSSTVLAAMTESAHRVDGRAQHTRPREASLDGLDETEPVRHARMVTWDRAGAAISRVAAEATVVETERTAAVALKPGEATARWDEFLGEGPTTNIHPRTGLPDADRIVSAYGTRSIRFGDHEMGSSATKFHFHEETWSFDPGANTWFVDNLMVRVPFPKGTW